MSIQTKICTCCKQKKESDSFYKSRYHKQCKQCILAKAKKRYYEKGYACLESKKLYREKNKEKQRQQQKQYRIKNRERLLIKSRMRMKEYNLRSRERRLSYYRRVDVRERYRHRWRIKYKGDCRAKELERLRVLHRKQRKVPSDRYIKTLIAMNTTIKHSEIPQELIETYRLYLILKRLKKEKLPC